MANPLAIAERSILTSLFLLTFPSRELTETASQPILCNELIILFLEGKSLTLFGPKPQVFTNPPTVTSK